VFRPHRQRPGPQEQEAEREATTASHATNER
jgi:hypothetical protein